MNFYKKLGEIRPNQLITTYGPGSIMDAVNDSLTVLDIEYWDTNNIGKEIRDARLASYMNVRRFFMPKTGGKEDIPVVSFPYYHVCSKGTCKFLFDMRDYFDMDQYKKNQGEVKCPKCGFPAYPSRFITVCEDGHMDDFPWRWWVHHGETSCKEDMYLKSMGNTSSLAELRVECNCGARRVMSGAMQKEKFAGLCCSGNHPHRPGAKARICKKSVIPSQRGASNVYFTVTRNAISIPPWTNPINDIMGAQRATIETLVEAMGEEAGLSFAYQKYFGDKYSYEDFKAAYDRLSQNIKEFTELKEMEYAAITHHEDVEYQHDVKYFKAEEVALSESLKEYISRIIKIHRLREVRVLTGFTRLEAPEPEVDEQSHIVKLKCSSGEKWLPAVEINGEGVFIELNKEKINQWMQIETVKSRSDKYEEYDRNEDGDMDITDSPIQLQNMYNRKSNTYAEHKIFPYVTKDDLRIDLMDKVRNLAKSKNPDHQWLTMSDDEIMKSAGLWEKDFSSGIQGYNLAGVLLFGKDDVIRSCCPGYITDALYRVENLDRYDDRLQVTTNLIEAYDLNGICCKAYIR